MMRNQSRQSRYLTSKTEYMISHCIERNVECPKYFLSADMCCGLGSAEDIILNLEKNPIKIIKSFTLHDD